MMSRLGFRSNGLFTQFIFLCLHTTIDSLSARPADTSERDLIEVRSGRTIDVLRSQEPVAVEVSMAVVRVGEESGLLTVEQVSVDTIGRRALTRAENETDRASEKCREHVPHSSGLRHADEINVWVEWPWAHVADVVARELAALAHRACEVERAVVGDGVEGVIAAAENGHRHQSLTRREAHVVELAVEGIGAGNQKLSMRLRINEEPDNPYKTPAEVHVKDPGPWPAPGLQGPGLGEHLCSLA